MRQIKITEEVETAEQMIDLLDNIAEKIANGYTSGHNPSWVLEGEDEKTEDQLIEDEIESKRSITDIMDDDS